SEWGRRVADAFARQWHALGGKLVARADFPRGEFDHSAIIQRFLGLEDSVARERILSAQLGLNLHFTPRRRDDIDFLFLAADAAQARSLVPQLRFFQAHDLALYATSAVYAGTPDAALDADLDGVAFGDLRWMLDDVAPMTTDAPAQDEAATSTVATFAPPRFAQFIAPDRLAQAVAEASDEVAPDAPDEAAPSLATGISVGASADADARESRRRYHNALDRLYALGLDSYNLLPALAALRDDPQRRYFGEAADISVRADGNAQRHLAWARFEHGLPQPLPPSLAPLAEALDAQP
ncbi:MAG: penicillin-binding protein activator, partial [bacterium]